MVDETLTLSRPARPGSPWCRPALRAAGERTPGAGRAGAFAAVRTESGEDRPDQSRPPPGGRPPPLKERGQHLGFGNRSLTFDPSFFLHLVHATVGIRPRPPKSAARIPTVAWTIEPGEFRARAVDERLRHRPEAALGPVVFECGRPELAARRRARLGAGTRPSAMPPMSAQARPSAGGTRDSEGTGMGEAERETGASA
jgi:hypothetical protein